MIREMELLFQASRTSPMLHEAVVTVEAGVAALRAERDELVLRNEHLGADIVAAEAEVARLRERMGQVADNQEASEPDTPDPGSFGGHPYTPTERALGYGTDNDPRLRSSDRSGPTPAEGDEWEARCHFCGGPCYPWLTDNETWAKVEPTLGQQQACFECFAAAWFKLGHNNGEPFRVSAGPDTPADSQTPFEPLSDDDMCEHGYVRDHAPHPAAGLERCPVCDSYPEREQ